jgi:hypothetical protein
MPSAFAIVSNAAITVPLTAGSGLAVPNYKAAKNFALSPSVRIPNSSCRVLPFAEPNRRQWPACRPPHVAIEDTNRLPTVHRKLEQIDAVTKLDDLNVPPGNKLHALGADRRGFHAV